MLQYWERAGQKPRLEEAIETIAGHDQPPEFAAREAHDELCGGDDLGVAEGVISAVDEQAGDVGCNVILCVETVRLFPLMHRRFNPYSASNRDGRRFEA